AHLNDKRHVSCEELTNIHMVFNESLELMKIAGDQSIMSGTTHPIFHGFNYSPLTAPYPGWVIYGTFINERNPWWPYFRQFTDYKARLSALLQRSTMFADIAVLPPTADLWSIYGAQNDPFPSVMYPEWQTLVWESIHQNGSGCDYISEHVMQDSNIQNGYLEYGSRRYHSLFLTHVQSIEPSTAKKLFDFVTSGGRVFFIETFPARAPGWKDHEQRDREVQGWISKMRSYTDRCVLLDQPGSDFTGWFKSVQHKYEINPYVTIDSPVKFVTQVRYQSKNVEILVFINSNMNEPYQITITPSLALASGKQPWLWNPETGLRYKMPMDGNKILLNMGPADLKLIVFDKQKKGPPLRPSDKASKETII